MKENRRDAELVGLLHEIFSEDIIRHLYRGYTILHPDTNTSKQPSQKIQVSLLTISFKIIQTQVKSFGLFLTFVQNCPILQRPVWFLFAGMGCQWPGMGKSLMSLPLFAQSIEQSHEILKAKNIDLIHIITQEDSTIFDNVLNSFVGITAIQVWICFCSFETNH